MDAGRGHPNGESESRDANRSGPDWSATSEANPTPLRQSADSPPHALPFARITLQNKYTRDTVSLVTNTLMILLSL